MNGNYLIHTHNTSVYLELSITFSFLVIQINQIIKYSIEINK